MTSDVDELNLAGPKGPGQFGRPSTFVVRGSRLKLSGAFQLAAAILLFLSVVVPNSLQVPTAVMLAVCLLLSLASFRMLPGLKNIFLFYGCSAIITVLYLTVGFLNGAPLLAVAQISVSYLIAPFLWIMFSARLFEQLGEERIVNWFLLLSLMCCISVALYFFLYKTRGASAVSFFTDAANVNTQGGYSGAVMHVYGPLIFLCGAFFSSPELIRSKYLRLVLLAGLLASAVTSGRAALVMSVPLGLLLGLLLTPRTINGRNGRSALNRVAKYGLPVLLSIMTVVAAIGFYTHINLSLILDGVINKIASGGGSERTGQAHALYLGILDSGGLGVGHGIGVPFIRSEDYPWRYELVWLATVLRVGIFGAFIYGSVFFVYIYAIIMAALRRRLTPVMKFMFCGFLCAFLASATNPYIEAFSLQWMYVIPVVGLFIRRAPVRFFKKKYE